MAKIRKITPIPDSGIDPSTSAEIFDQIAMFAGYGFNKSHAAAYAAIGFQTGYLKTHFPESYFAAAMNLELSEVDEIATFATQLKARNIMLWLPDINMSTDIFRPIKLHKARQGRDYAIAYALTAIRGVGRNTAIDIVNERARAGAFADAKDFAARMGTKVNKKAALALVHAGAFDRINDNRALVAAEITGAKASGADVGQLSMFDMEPAMDTTGPVAEYGYDEKLNHEFDVLGHFLSDHPLRGLRQSLFDNNQYFSNTILDGDRHPPRVAKMPAVVCAVDLRQTKKGDTMAVILLSDPDRTYEALAIGGTWSEIKDLMRKKNRVEITSTVMAEGVERTLFIESARALSETHECIAEAA